MDLNKSIFRAYDIRGLVDIDLTPEIAEAIGKAYGSKIRQLSGNKIVVGGDNRTTTVPLKKALIKGILSTGCDVTDIGISTSPMLYFSVCFYGFDGGVNVTGSHNSIDYNGFKMTQKNALPIFGEDIQEMYNMIENKDFVSGDGSFEEKKVLDDYVKAISERVNLKKKLKIVIDTGNGTPSIFVPELFRKLGCEVVELFCESDGTFPNHLPDPEDETTLDELKAKVLSEKADLGIAFDGDGDRVGIVDENAKRWEADYLLILLTRDVLTRNPGSKIIFEVKCSETLSSEIKKLGGEPVLWKVGHSLIKKKMKEIGAILGGEVSGHIFFAENWYGFDDATLAAARLLEYYSKSDKKFSEHFADIPKVYNTPEIKLPCSDSKKFEVVRKVSEYFKDKYEAITVDGIRIIFGDGAWGLVRPSNTNPYLTVRFEAKTPERLEEIKNIVFDKLREYPEVTVN